MQDIMNTLHIAKGTTYHYFKSKEDLLDAVVEDMVGEFVRVIASLLAESKGNALDKMKVLISSGRNASPSKGTMEALHRSHNSTMHTHILTVTLTKLASLYAQVIAQGCEEGIFSVDHPLESAEMLLAGIQFVTDIGCYAWSTEDRKRRMQAIPSMIENQLHAPKGSFSNFFNHMDIKD